MLGHDRGIAGLAALVVLAGCSGHEPAASEIVTVAEPPRVPMEPDELTRRQLEALGYVDARPTLDPDLRGVVDAPRAAPERSRGLNLYASRDRASAVLLDMAGNEIHRWQDDGSGGGSRRTWMHVEPLPSGDLLVVTKDRDLTRYDARSRIVWRRTLRAHHDVAVHDDGRIFALTRAVRQRAHRGETVPILADAITVLSPDGEVVREVDLVALLEDEISERRLARVLLGIADGTPVSRLVREGAVGDVLHANSLALLSHGIAGVAPAGSVLVSLRAISRIAILDADLTRVLWLWGRGELEQQHDATQLESGRLLVFDNGVRRQQSRVIELDAATGEIVWSYTSPELFSRIRGGAQLLPSGNVLVTESEKGHALEVTRAGDVVWELWNPDVRGGSPPRRAVIYRLNRFPESFFDPALGWHARRAGAGEPIDARARGRSGH